MGTNSSLGIVVENTQEADENSCVYIFTPILHWQRAIIVQSRTYFYTHVVFFQTMSTFHNSVYILISLDYVLRVTGYFHIDKY